MTNNYDENLQLIVESLLCSYKNWYSLVYYKPLNIITYIITKNYLEIDEPNIKLSEESLNLINLYSSKSPDFIIFPFLYDEDRELLVVDFIGTLPTSQNDYYLKKWNKDGNRVISNWRPYVLISFFEEDNEQLLFGDFVKERYKHLIDNFAKKNNIDLTTAVYKNIFY